MPCLVAFGADQFDGQHPEECKEKSSFFNWWYFGICIGATLTLMISTYIQDNLSWVLGFGIPCIIMVFALILFLLGTVTYRFHIYGGDTRPFRRISRVFVRAVRNWRTASSAVTTGEESQRLLPYQGSEQFKFLNKALLGPGGLNEAEEVCSMSEVEEANAVLRLLPIWATCLVYAIVFSQSSTLFTKQGVTLDRSISSSFEIPPASLQTFISVTIVLFIPIYDRILVPVARGITGKPSGITTLQRIGTGLFVSFLAMVVAALVERKRLETAREYGLVDKPDATIPMSIKWLIPQYVLFGIHELLTSVGLQELFYDQAPPELKSVGLALYVSIFGIGSFLCNFLISLIEKATGGEGRYSWFSDNLNRAHLDYFYWLLAGLTAAAFVVFVYVAKPCIRNQQKPITEIPRGLNRNHC